MQSVNISDLIYKIQSQKHITDEDCKQMRRAVFIDGRVSTQEADALFALNGLSKKPEDWDMLFVETITHFLVRQTMPHGYINQANAAWLLARINHDGVVESRTELELLLSVLKRADNVTESIEKFALDQVVEAVINGRGYMGKNRALEPGAINKDDVELLRRVLYACSSEGGVGISQSEAEVLFNLNDATIHAKNDPSWTRLFVGGIANYIMMVAAWNEPEAQEALRRENWLGDTRKTGFFANLTSTASRNLTTNVFTPLGQFDYSHTNNGAVIAAERVSQTEAHWLIKRINNDGVLHENEKELLRFLKEESPEIHESLTAYLDVV